MGKSVACVERAELGGICLNWGCIPTKTLLHDAHLFHQILTEGAAFGLAVDKSKLQWDKIVARSRQVAGTLSGQIGFLFKKFGIVHLKGSGFVARGAGASGASPCLVDVKDDKGAVETVSAKFVLICTGARNRELPGMKVDGQNVLSSREAMILKEIPKKL